MDFFTILDIVGAIALLLIFVAVILLIMRWLYRDAEARGQSGNLVVLVTFLSGFFFGLLLWMVLRPPKIRDRDIRGVLAEHERSLGQQHK
jgi:RsiW-degrading membrane proteinase PrsW (M82 family)